MSGFVVVIPARWASRRLAGKPLLDIAGKPMLERVWDLACRSSARLVVVATDDARIAEVAKGFGAPVCMTASTHRCGSERVSQACDWMELAADDIVVNVQGDEPLLPPALVDQAAGNLAARPGADIATLCEPLWEVSEWRAREVVKVVRDAEDCALYFSRAALPWRAEDAPGGGPLGHRHIGVYAYRVALLRRFVRWPAPESERRESLEQLRALHHGARIHVADAAQPAPGGVDTDADMARVRALWADGPVSDAD